MKTPAGDSIDFEVAILERTVDAAAAKEPGLRATKWLELANEGKLLNAQHLKLATIEQVESRVQLGEQAPVVTARNIRPGREGAPNFGGFAGGESITYMDLGTLLTITSRVEEGGHIVAAIDLQRTSFAPVKPVEKPEGQDVTSVNPPRRLTLTVSSNVRLSQSEPVIISSQQSRQGDSTVETCVVVFARKR